MPTPLAEGQRKFICSANDFSLASGQGGGQNIRKHVSHIRPQFLIAVSIYLALFDSFIDHQKLHENLSDHFSINRRTLKGVIKMYKCYKIA